MKVALDDSKSQTSLEGRAKRGSRLHFPRTSSFEEVTVP